MARMTDVNVDFISLVTKGANKQKVQIYKADDYEPEIFNNNENIEEVTGFFNAIKSFFSGEDVRKLDKKVVKEFREGEVEDMKKEELQEIIKEVIQPLSDKIGDMETEINKGQVTVANKGNEGNAEISITKEDIKKALEEVIEPLERRINKIENFKGISKQIDDEEDTFQKSDNFWDGLDI